MLFSTPGMLEVTSGVYTAQQHTIWLLSLNKIFFPSWPCSFLAPESRIFKPAVGRKGQVLSQPLQNESPLAVCSQEGLGDHSGPRVPIQLPATASPAHERTCPMLRKARPPRPHPIAGPGPLGSFWEGAEDGGGQRVQGPTNIDSNPLFKSRKHLLNHPHLSVTGSYLLRPSPLPSSRSQRVHSGPS